MTVFLSILLFFVLLIALILLADISVVLKVKDTFDIKIRFLGIRIPVERFIGKDGEEEEKLKETKEKYKKSHKKKTAGDIIDLMSFIVRLIRAVVAEFVRYVRIKLCRINVKVASDDAAETARLYGAVSGAVFTAVELFDSFMKISKNYKKISVVPDFTSDSCEADIKVILKIRTIHVILALIHLLPTLAQGKKGKSI